MKVNFKGVVYGDEAGEYTKASFEIDDTKIDSIGSLVEFCGGGTEGEAIVVDLAISEIRVRAQQYARTRLVGSEKVEALSAEAVAEELFGTWTVVFLSTVMLLTIAALGTIALAYFRDVPEEEMAE